MRKGLIRIHRKGDRSTGRDCRFARFAMEVLHGRLMRYLSVL